MIKQNKIYIYYSLSGDGEFVARKMEELGYVIQPVKTVWNPPKLTLPLMLSCGFLAGIGKKLKLKPFEFDQSKYDEIIIGSPIWNSRLSCPINTVLNMIKNKNKIKGFVLYSGSGKAKRVTKKINKLYPKANVTILKQPLTYKNEISKIR